MNVQGDLNLHCAYMSAGMFSYIEAHFYLFDIYLLSGYKKIYCKKCPTMEFLMSTTTYIFVEK